MLQELKKSILKSNPIELDSTLENISIFTSLWLTPIPTRVGSGVSFFAENLLIMCHISRDASKYCLILLGSCSEQPSHKNLIKLEGQIRCVAAHVVPATFSGTQSRACASGKSCFPWMLAASMNP